MEYRGKERQKSAMKALRDAIPSHCHKASPWISVYYIVRDGALCGSLITLALYISKISSWQLQWVSWALYGFCQGLVFTGIWIIGHECGHQALFNGRLINDSVGWVLHSILLVPYFSWKFSHGKHHRYTNHMEKDTAFVPSTEAKLGVLARLDDMTDTGQDAPALNLILLIGHQLLGWPLYLFFHITAGENSEEGSHQNVFWYRNHFNPWSKMFSDSQRLCILVSDIGILTMMFLLREAASYLGATQVFLLYGMPYLWVNHWIVAITYLHHTHPNAYHYGANEWTYENGALSTIDREFGVIGRGLFHGIIEYHVIHHLFPKIPFYYAEEATEAIKPLLGKRYLRDETPFFISLWKSFTRFQYVEPLAEGSEIFKWAQHSPTGKRMVYT